MDISCKTQKDERFLEQTRHGEAEFPFRFYKEDVWAFDFHCIDWHWHPEVEFIYAEKGEISCFVGTEQFILPEGCGLFVNSGILHRYEAARSVSMPNIVFSPELLGAKSGKVYQNYIAPVLGSAAPYLLFRPSVDRHREILQHLLRIFRLQETQDNEMKTVAALLELWQQVYLHIPLPSGQGSGDKGRRAQMQVMMQFIHANYHRQIALQEIAQSVHISESSALQLFRRGIHLSPVAYLIQYRLKRAADLLATTNKTVAAVAYESGFSDAGYFCRTFRKFYRADGHGVPERAKTGDPPQKKTQGRGAACKSGAAPITLPPRRRKRLPLASLTEGGGSPKG